MRSPFPSPRTSLKRERRQIQAISQNLTSHTDDALCPPAQPQNHARPCDHPRLAATASTSHPFSLPHAGHHASLALPRFQSQAMASTLACATTAAATRSIRLSVPHLRTRGLLLCPPIQATGYCSALRLPRPRCSTLAAAASAQARCFSAAAAGTFCLACGLLRGLGSASR